MADTTTTPKRSGTTKKTDNIWSDEERAAMQASARERKKTAKLTPEEARAAGEADVLAAIAAMPDDDRVMATRVHEIAVAVAPDLEPRTFYGMPAYAKNGKVICFFQSKLKFKVRYSTLGFQPDARLDDGDLWPVAFALVNLTPAGEKRVAELIQKAAS